jgi:Putative Actinobacterial Holin-X, holin superfamily III
MTDPRLTPPLRELLNGISTDVQLLASQTLTLARLETSTAASKLAWSAAGLLASVLVTVAGAAVLVSALVLTLIALGLPAWAASTLVGVTLTGAGAIAANYSVGSIRSAELGMKETRESLRETIEWLKLQTRASRSSGRPISRLHGDREGHDS